MIIEELEVTHQERVEKDNRGWEERGLAVIVNARGEVGVWDAKRVLIGAGARVLFYPTLFYNVIRNRIQSEFRWWDPIGEFLLLGAVPFPTDVPRLKALGVQGVITLNEHYETLVPSSLYQAYNIDHLILPTRDYCFAPSLNDISRAVEFIDAHVSRGETVYVHCKAGRGRSTTIVLCYLVQHHLMSPKAAYDYVKSIRPRILLAHAQWLAVNDYYNLKLKNEDRSMSLGNKFTAFVNNAVRFDDGSVVFVTEADVDGYEYDHQVADISVIYSVRLASKEAIARVSCLWRVIKTRKRSVKNYQAGKFDY